MSPQICECRFCGDEYTPQGVKSHESFCDENPRPGVPYDFQVESGILDEDHADEDDTEAAPATPDPHQETDGACGLPSRSTVSSGKSVPEGGDDNNPEECPRCGSGDVLDAADALDAYRAEVDTEHPKAVLAYELADRACCEPDCAALWGEEYDRPLTMAEVINA